MEGPILNHSARHFLNTCLVPGPGSSQARPVQPEQSEHGRKGDMMRLRAHRRGHVTPDHVGP